MGVFNDSEISSMVFTLLGMYSGMLEPEQRKKESQAGIFLSDKWVGYEEHFQI